LAKVFHLGRKSLSDRFTERDGHDVGGVDSEAGLPFEGRRGRRVHDLVVLGKDGSPVRAAGLQSRQRPIGGFGHPVYFRTVDLPLAEGSAVGLLMATGSPVASSGQKSAPVELDETEALDNLERLGGVPVVEATAHSVIDVVRIDWQMTARSSDLASTTPGRESLGSRRFSLPERAGVAGPSRAWEDWQGPSVGRRGCSRRNTDFRNREGARADGNADYTCQFAG
jgi:hypothetical protein